MSRCYRGVLGQFEGNRSVSQHTIREQTVGRDGVYAAYAPRMRRVRLPYSTGKYTWCNVFQNIHKAIIRHWGSRKRIYKIVPDELVPATIAELTGLGFPRNYITVVK